MNLIKLKDIIKEGDEFFNKHLKGKYAYWIHLRYIVSFDHMKHEGYVACENDITRLLKKDDGTYPIPYGAPYIDVYDDSCEIIPFIDVKETDKINSVIEFARKNNYATDDDITIDELKKFRTWLATQLLSFDINNKGEQLYELFDSDETYVLTYYKNGMYDNVIKYLNTFGKVDINIINNITSSSCGCGRTDLSSLYNMGISVCDPLLIYRKNIYNKMVEMFSPYTFWKDYPIEFIKEFKKYIDNIINADFKLTKCSYISDFVDCGCEVSNEQENMLLILKRLSQSLSYIINNQIVSHKNYINDAFKDWATYLYEKMEWS